MMNLFTEIIYVFDKIWVCKQSQGNNSKKWTHESLPTALGLDQ